MRQQATMWQLVLWCWKTLWQEKATGRTTGTPLLMMRQQATMWQLFLWCLKTLWQECPSRQLPNPLQRLHEVQLQRI